MLDRDSAEGGEHRRHRGRDGHADTDHPHREAVEEVDVVAPAIDLQKTSVRPEVLDFNGIDPAVTDPTLDPGGGAVGGGDVPLVTPAVYGYLVTNPGQVPLRTSGSRHLWGPEQAVPDRPVARHAAVQRR